MTERKRRYSTRKGSSRPFAGRIAASTGAISGWPSKCSGFRCGGRAEGPESEVGDIRIFSFSAGRAVYHGAVPHSDDMNPTRDRMSCGSPQSKRAELGSVFMGANYLAPIFFRDAKTAAISVLRG